MPKWCGPNPPTPEQLAELLELWWDAHMEERLKVERCGKNPPTPAQMHDAYMRQLENNHANNLARAIGPSPPTPQSVQVTVGPGRHTQSSSVINPFDALSKLFMFCWHYFAVLSGRLRILAYVGVGYTSFVDHFHHWVVFAVCAGLSLIGQRTSNYTKFLKGGFR